MSNHLPNVTSRPVRQHSQARAQEVPGVRPSPGLLHDAGFPLTELPDAARPGEKQA